MIKTEVVEKAKMAFRTGWATEPNDRDAYVLLLEDDKGGVIAGACYTLDVWREVFASLLEVARDAAYDDAHFSERKCDRCGKPYRGPAVYCSFACAEADA